MSTLNSILGNPSLVTFSMHPLSEAADLLACTQEDINVVASNGLIKLCVKVPEDMVTVLTVKRQNSSQWNNDFYERMPDTEYLELSHAQCKNFAINDYIHARQFDERGFEYRHPTYLKSRKISQFEEKQGYPIIPKDYYYYILVKKSVKTEDYEQLTIQLFSNEHPFLLEELYISSDQLKELGTLLTSEWANEQRDLGCLSSLLATKTQHTEDTGATAPHESQIDATFSNKNFPSWFVPHNNIPPSLHNLANLVDKIKYLMKERYFLGADELHEVCEEYFEEYENNKKKMNALKAMVAPLPLRERFRDNQNKDLSHVTPEFLAAFEVSQKFWANIKTDGSESFPNQDTIKNFLVNEHKVSNNIAELIDGITLPVERKKGRPKNKK